MTRTLFFFSLLFVLLLLGGGAWLTPSAAQGVVTVPDAPTNLTADSGDAQVTLRWTAPANDGGLPITGYEYRQKDSGDFGDWTAIPDSGAATTQHLVEDAINRTGKPFRGSAATTQHLVEGLTNGTEYTFRVRARNANGPSARYATVSATPALVSSSVPDVPANLTADSGDAQVTLRWTAPANDGGSPITGYEYRQRDSSTSFGPWTAIPNSAPGQGNAVSYTLSGLTNGTRYIFRVRARNANGPSARSDTVNATPAPVPGSTPDAPTDLTAERGDAQVTLRWTAPANDGGSPITGYEYRQRGSGSFDSWTAIPDSAPGQGNAVSYTLSGLTNGTRYTFRVRARNANGPSARYATVNATPALVSGTVPDAPTNLKADSGDAQVTLRWAAPSDGGSPITGYEYRQRGSGSFDSWTAIPDSAPGQGNAVSYTLSGLTNGTRYTFRVRARNANGPSARYATVNATPAPIPGSTPDAPTNLKADSGDAQVTLRWTAPSDGGSPITGYEYRQRGSGSFDSWTAIPDSAPGQGNAVSYTLSGLTNGTRYTFRVRARNANGPGAFSSATATPQTADTTAPTVSIHSDASLTNTAFTLTFDFSEPLGAGAGGFTQEDISLTGTGTADLAAPEVSPTDNTRYTVIVTPSADGTFIVNLKEGAVQDDARNPYLFEQGNAVTITYDATPPTVALTSPDVAAGPFQVAFQFSEALDTALNPFDAADIRLTGDTSATLGTPTADAIDTKRYTVTITPQDTFRGDITINLKAGAVQDAAGNVYVLAAQRSVTTTVDFPTVSNIEFASTGPYRANDNIWVKVTFSSAVDVYVGCNLLLNIGDTQRSAWPVADAASTSRLSGPALNVTSQYYCYTVQSDESDADGVTTYEFPFSTGGRICRPGEGADARNCLNKENAHRFTQPSGQNTLVASATHGVDTSVPSVTAIVPATTGVQVTTLFSVSLTFSEPVSDVTAADITSDVQGTTVSNVTPSGGAPATTWTAAIEVPDNTTGNLTLAVRANAVRDAAGNTGPTDTYTSPSAIVFYTLWKDVNSDGKVDVLDLVAVASHFGQTIAPDTVPNPDVNRSGVVDKDDLIAVMNALLAINLPANPAPAQQQTGPTLTAATLQHLIHEAKRLNRSDAAFHRGIRVLEELLASLLIPAESALFPNYPNPFNPETWIPYQLAQPASVTLTFYDVRGHVVRRLALGHHAAGTYQSKGRAAYWDGRNEFGESVASGVYFYTLVAGEFTATGKMLIMK